MDSASHEDKPTKHHHHRQPPSSSELMSSAKLVAEAAKATLHHETDKVDKARVAGAAADLLEAASHYAKLEEKSFGKYVEQAENYLHKYESSQPSFTTSASGHQPATHSSSSHSSSHSAPPGSDDDHSGNKYGEYFKMAEGFLKKH